MLTINIRLVGLYRRIANTPDLTIEIASITDNHPTDIYDLIKTLCMEYKDMEELIYSEPNKIDDWSRIMLNGKDIRFLIDEAKILKDGDNVHIFSMAAGG